MNSLPLIPLPLPTGVDMKRLRLTPVTKIIEIRDPKTGITAKLALSGNTWKVEAENDYRGATCAEFGFGKKRIIYNPGENPTLVPVMHMDDLFAGLNETEYIRCDMKPNNLLATGHGTLILDYATQMASGEEVAGVCLTNAATFPDWRIPDPSVELNKMTIYLTLVRGFGFYESRGFTSMKYPCGEPDVILPHVRRDLLWNHMICTTPLNVLQSKILERGRALMWEEENRSADDAWAADEAWGFVVNASLANVRILLSEVPAKKQEKSMRSLFTQIDNEEDKKTAIKVGEFFESIWKRYDGYGSGPDGDGLDEVPGPFLIQRIFRIPPTASDAPAPVRINIRSDENDKDAPPIVELVPIEQRIESKVLFEA